MARVSLQRGWTLPELELDELEDELEVELELDELEVEELDELDVLDLPELVELDEDWPELDVDDFPEPELLEFSPGPAQANNKQQQQDKSKLRIIKPPEP